MRNAGNLRSRTAGCHANDLRQAEHATASLRDAHCIAQQNGGLEIYYHAQVVRVHATYKSRTGTGNPRTYASLKPKDDGFVLTTYVFEHKPSDPPRAYQAVKRKGDTFEFGDYQLEGTNEAVYLNFKWGPHTNSRLLNEFRHAVTDHAKLLH